MNGLIKASLIIVTAFGILGCASGGGNTQSFKKWESLTPAITRLLFNGNTVESAWTGNGGTVQTYNGGTFADGKAELVYKDKQLMEVLLRLNSGTLVWDKDRGDKITDNGNVLNLENATGDNFAIQADSIALGHNYQTFGAWITGFDTGSGSGGSVGAYSMGDLTLASNVPASGTPTFTGMALGTYVDSTGNNVYTTTADASVAVDFTARTLAFTTNNTNQTHIVTKATTANATLNLSGTLSYSAGFNSFAGSIVSGGGMNGLAQGEFYGPAAEELGGTFQLDSGSGVEHYTGSFGAAR